MKTTSIEYTGLEHPALRQRGEDFETVILELQRLDNNHIARLIGMCHIGDPKYYESINMLFDQRPSSKILAENIHVPEGIDSNDSVAQMIRKNILLDIDRYRMLAEASLGTLVQQSAGLQIPPERAVKCDIPFHELRDAVANGETHQFNEVEPSLQELAGDILMEIPALAFIGRAKIRSGFHRTMVNHANTSNQTASEQDPIAVVRRNALVVEAIQRETETEDVEVPWGWAHIPGIVDGLTRSGKWELNKTSVEYLTFYSPDVVRGWLDRFVS